jgi:hypothetical protein
VQEYLMQAGTLFKAVGTVFICAVAAHTIIVRRNPSSSKRMKYIVTCVAISLFFLALSISFQSARLFCDVNIQKYSEASLEMKLATLSYFFAFAVPVYLCCLVDFGFFMFMRYRLNALLGFNASRESRNGLPLGPGSSPSLASRGESADSEEALGQLRSTTTVVKDTQKIRESEIKIVVNRLIMYPLVFVCGWLPDSLALVIILVTGSDVVAARLVANACAGSTGWAMALCYFLFEWKIEASASKFEKTPIVGIMKNSSDTMTQSLGSTDIVVPRFLAPGIMDSEVVVESEIEGHAYNARRAFNLKGNDLGCTDIEEGDGENRPSSFTIHIEAYDSGSRDNMPY